MERKFVRDKTEEFMQGRWGNIIVVKLISGLITLLVSSFFIVPILMTFVASSLVSTNIDGMYAEPNIAILIGSFVTLFASMAAVLTLSGLVHRLISGGLDINIMKSYEEHEKISFGGAFNYAKNNFVAILIVSFAVSFLGFIAGKVPVVGFIISIYITYATIFAYALIGDKSAKDGIEALKMSYEHTKGHVLDLFLISFYYSIRPLIGLVIILFGFMFLLLSETLALILIIVGFAVMIVLGIKYIPYSTTAPIIFYELLKEERNVEEMEDVFSGNTETVEVEVVDPEDSI